MQRKLKQRLSGQWRGVLSLTLPIGLGTIVASSAGWLLLLEWAALDWFFRLRPPEPPDDRIVIVTINESDISRVGQWPLPDSVLAKLIQNLKLQQPQVIGLGIYRDLPVPPGHDALNTAIKSTPNLIAVEKFGNNPIPPPPVLKDSNRVAFSDLILDQDGKIRRGLISIREKETIKLSLGAAVALNYLEHQGMTPEIVEPAAKSQLRLGKALFIPLSSQNPRYAGPNAGGYQILLNYRGMETSFHRISMTDVLENRIPPGLMRDRIVLIGVTASSINDLFLTPYSNNTPGGPQPTSGIFIHANLASQIVSSVLDGRPLIYVWEPIWEWLWILLWSGIGAILGRRLLPSSNRLKNTLPGVIGAIVLLGGGFAGVCYLAFLASWWVPLVPPLVGATTSGIATLLYYSRQMHFQKERTLTRFLEALPVAIGVLDAKGRPYFANQKAREILGKGVVPDTTAAQIAQVYQNYIAGTNIPYPSEKLPVVRALHGEITSADDIEIHVGDKVIPIEAWGSPIYDEEGNIAYAIVAFQDITDRRRLEAQSINFTSEIFQINQAWERFVPRQFLQLLNKNSIAEVKLGDAVQKEMSVLFSDIRSFTSLSETMTPEDNFKFINSYLSIMEPAIRRHNGFIDKYIGDAIMALFSGSLEENSTQTERENLTADDAVRAGIEMIHQLREYNQGRQRAGYKAIEIGIGINTGLLMLGTVGGHNRMDGTVISDAVNLAARIENLTKNYGVSLLISHKTFSQLQDPNEYAIRIIDRVKVKGKSDMVSVFEVFDADGEEIKQKKLVTREKFERGILLFRLGDWAGAYDFFEFCLKIYPADSVALFYYKHCQHHLKRSM
ncbi:MAG TPA: CHASE2 domain-containing protein [Oscillatoriaceae cyanobacterium M33_DOE_052]|uniref:CHASE2 domain-containing protein n=1 Tax=Planktothricoides sp. SpSt-374 TaxID=2282167 RepID=A0A7C3VKR2_9CYAN|nr:CHASE2 domain-containing protein [Oscillatoriaceae cyanobacterium M33_DOE_052]